MNSYKQWRKTIFILVTLIFTLSLILTGCGSSQSSGGGSSSPSASSSSGGDSKQTTTADSTASSSTAASSAPKDDAASFYKGKKMSFIVPYDPGGGYDEYARMIAPFIEKYTGAKIEINNMPGAGGMKGVNELYVAPNDGLTIGIINGSAMITNQLAKISGVKYDLGKLGYLGRMVSDPRVLVVSTKSPYKTFEDMMNSQTTIKLGATGLGGSTYVDAVIMAKAFDLNQNVIHGFDSSSLVDQAIQRGEISGMWGSWGSRQKAVKNGEVRVVLQSEKNRLPDIPDIPTVYEMAQKTKDPAATLEIIKYWAALNDVGRPVAAPPGVQPDRLKFLQDVFEKAMNDPDLLAVAKQGSRDLGYVSGAEMAQIAQDATQMPPEIEQLFVKAIKGEL